MPDRRLRFGQRNQRILKALRLGDRSRQTRQALIDVRTNTLQHFNGHETSNRNPSSAVAIP
jgi:hypothetical protein